MLCLAGVGFAFEPEAALTPGEKRSLDALRAMGGETTAPPRSLFRMLLSKAPLRPDPGPDAFPPGSPARVDWARDRVEVSHRQFLCELDPLHLAGRLYRSEPDLTFPLQLSLRVALASRLPLEGGLPLHAAGILTGDRGLAFFGPSGAGKSTLAARSPHPVLSDELLAVVPGRPFGVVRTGFFGTLGTSNAPPGAFPLRALIELAKGSRFRLTPLTPRDALRRLLGAILVPIGPPLWSAALEVAGRLTRAVPAYRMEWSPGAPPWDQLEDALRSG